MDCGDGFKDRGDKDDIGIEINIIFVYRINFFIGEDVNFVNIVIFVK